MSWEGRGSVGDGISRWGEVERERGRRCEGGEMGCCHWLGEDKEDLFGARKPCMPFFFSFEWCRSLVVGANQLDTCLKCVCGKDLGQKNNKSKEPCSCNCVFIFIRVKRNSIISFNN